jgi:hypothetical protein
LKQSENEVWSFGGRFGDGTPWIRLYVEDNGS